MITVSRIANANRGDLLCITYEFLLEQIGYLIDIKTDNDQEADTLVKYYKHLDKCKQILAMLVRDLDFNQSISGDLFKLYVYVQGVLIKAKTVEELEVAQDIINKLYEAFEEAAKEDESSSVMKNTEEVYAGLTYGPNDINETVTGSTGRGYNA